MQSDEIFSLTGSGLPYNYREIPKRCSDNEIKNYIHRTRDLFDPIAKKFDNDLNTEWFVRSYLALKLTLGATVLASSAEHAEQQNLQVTLPYLRYYVLLNCCRSFLLTLPCITWKSIDTIELEHSKILNTTSDKLKRLGRRHKDALESRLWAAKEQRDLFSYRFPATGLSIFGDKQVSVNESIEIARALTELSQINLSCLEARVVRYKEGERFDLTDHDDMWHAMRYEKKTYSIIDDEDYYRVGRFLHKYKGPCSLAGLATEGLVEDFFGAWASPDNRDDPASYNPDADWRLLLDI